MTESQKGKYCENGALAKQLAITSKTLTFNFVTKFDASKLHPGQIEYVFFPENMQILPKYISLTCSLTSYTNKGQEFELQKLGVIGAS